MFHLGPEFFALMNRHMAKQKKTVALRRSMKFVTVTGQDGHARLILDRDPINGQKATARTPSPDLLTDKPVWDSVCSFVKRLLASAAFAVAVIVGL